jgi:UDP-N-acetylmuramate: L-alanyl-gamma-D-glutamyl-meso-diaminopimelate ligase
MRIHIIGVGTTFMSGLALLARQAGHDVTGSDSCITPDIRRKLEAARVQLKEPFSIKNLESNPELIVIGNELFPGNVELLEARHRALPYISGALWLEEYVLHDKWSEVGNDLLAEVKKHAPKRDLSPKPAKHAPKLPEHDKTKQRILR